MGIPAGTVEILLASLSSSTMKQYNAALKGWWLFCQNKGYNFYEPDSSGLLEFLTQKFFEGAQYGSLNCMRSAISLLGKNKFTRDILLNRFFRGVYRLRPTKPKYKETWNPNRVLSHVYKWYPLESLNLKQLSEKLIILMSLATAHRVQTFSLIDITNITFVSDGARIKIVDMIKTSKPNCYNPMLFLPYFREKPELCVASTLKWYLSVTSKFRKTSTKLFLSLNKPHKPVGSQTISRWIRSILSDCGIDVKVFGAHSTRHASTSSAFQKGINLEIIRNTAGWTDTSAVFHKFYNQPIIPDENEFAKAVFS